MFLVKFLGFVNRITGTLQAQMIFWIQMKRTSDNRTGSSLFIHDTDRAEDRDEVFSFIIALCLRGEKPTTQTLTPRNVLKTEK